MSNRDVFDLLSRAIRFFEEFPLEADNPEIGWRHNSKAVSIYFRNVSKSAFRDACDVFSVGREQIVVHENVSDEGDGYLTFSKRVKVGRVEYWVDFTHWVRANSPSARSKRREALLSMVVGGANEA